MYVNVMTGSVGVYIWVWHGSDRATYLQVYFCVVSNVTSAARPKQANNKEND